jgi:hypothetical protein
MAQGDEQAGEAEKREMLSRWRPPGLESERHRRRDDHHHDIRHEGDNHHRNARGHVTSDQIARCDQHSGGEGKQGGRRDSGWSWLSDQKGAGEAHQSKPDARTSDTLAKKEGDGQDKDERRGLKDRDRIGDRQASQRHDVAEDAQRFPCGSHERARMYGRGDDAPVPERDE